MISGTPDALADRPQPTGRPSHYHVDPALNRRRPGGSRGPSAYGSATRRRRWRPFRLAAAPKSPVQPPGGLVPPTPGPVGRTDGAPGGYGGEAETGSWTPPSGA